MLIILFVWLIIFDALLKGVNRHKPIPLATITRGNMCIFAIVLMSTATTVVGDNSSVLLTNETPKPQSTVFPQPEGWCFGESCEGRCGKISEPDLFMPCSCDKDCIIYQDCCLDFGSLCTDDIQEYTPGQIISPPEGTPPLSCVYHKKYSFYPIYMVDRCLKDYKKQDVKALCEDHTSDLVLRHLPVTDGNSSFVYRNVYCAICNSLNISGLGTFQNYFVCPFNETASKKYLEKRPLSDITFTEISEARCKVQILPDDFEGRKCIKVDLDTCPEPGVIKDACEAYFEPMKIWSTEPYSVARNRYCVSCNGVSDKFTMCWGERISIDKLGPGLEFSLRFDFTAIAIPDERSVPNPLPGTSRSTHLLESSHVRFLKHCFLDIFIIWISYERTSE